MARLRDQVVELSRQGYSLKQITEKTGEDADMVHRCIATAKRLQELPLNFRPSETDKGERRVAQQDLLSQTALTPTQGDRATVVVKDPVAQLAAGPAQVAPAGPAQEAAPAGIMATKIQEALANKNREMTDQRLAFERQLADLKDHHRRTVQDKDAVLTELRLALDEANKRAVPENDRIISLRERLQEAEQLVAAGAAQQRASAGKIGELEGEILKLKIKANEDAGTIGVLRTEIADLKARVEAPQPRRIVDIGALTQAVVLAHAAGMSAALMSKQSGLSESIINVLLEGWRADVAVATPAQSGEEG